MNNIFLLETLDKAEELVKAENPNCFLDVSFEGSLTDQAVIISVINRLNCNKVETISFIANHTEGKSDLDKVFERMNQDLSKWIEKMKERLQDD